jgi:8-oxo-dGTP diphosphatase
MKRIVVTAAVIERDGAYLVTRRPQGVHLEGCWEFPGGKCQPGESLEDCLRREMAEELDCRVTIRRELLATAHDYDDRTVELHFLACDLDGTPRAILGQEMRWVPANELQTLEFPPADDEVIRLLAR